MKIEGDARLASSQAVKTIITDVITTYLNHESEVGQSRRVHGPTWIGHYNGDDENVLHDIITIFKAATMSISLHHHNINSKIICLPAHGPMMTEICGMTPEAMTFCWKISE